MNKQGTHISIDVIYHILQGCINQKDLSRARELRSFIQRSGIEVTSLLGSHLIRTFALCGSLCEANEVFSSLPKTDMFTWHAIISAHAKSEQNQAIKLYYQLQNSNLKPDEFVFVTVLKACSSAAFLHQGKLIHADIVECGSESDIYIGSTLIDMYAKCGNIEDARKSFDKLPKRNVVSWNVMIAGYAQGGLVLEALVLFEQMLLEQMKPDNVTFFSLLKACSSTAASDCGKLIHFYIIESGLESNVALSNTLIDMYAKCERLEDARKLFDNLLVRSVVTWNAMITGYVQHGHALESLQLFQQLQQEGRKPDKVTFISILKACSSVAGLNEGKLIHIYIMEISFELDHIVGNSLIDMYSKCGSFEDAQKLFGKLQKQDVVSWNAMIGGHAQYGHGHEALQYFQDMQKEGVEPDSITFASILKACSSIKALDQGKKFHAHISNCSYKFDLLVSNTLIDMYAKCGRLEEARRVFDKVPVRDVVTWNAMILGYVQHGLDGQEALELSKQMQQERIKPNIVTYVSILKACSSTTALDQGKVNHACIIQSNLQSNVLIGSTLIDLYAECGSLEDAHGVFDSLPKQDVVTWSAMIAGCSLHKNYKLALEYFKDMQREGLKPDSVTFVCLLSVCSHMGLMEDAHYYFNSMDETYGFSPTLDHYNCMVDLLGRVGHLQEAEGLLHSMPFQGNIVGWRSLLGNCKTYGNVELGRRCFDLVIEMDCRNASAYVLMLDIYTNAEMWQRAVEIQCLREQALAWKKPGHAFIEVDNHVHSFVVEDEGHPQHNEVYAKVNTLTRKMTDKGHVPQLNMGLQEMPDDDTIF